MNDKMSLWILNQAPSKPHKPRRSHFVGFHINVGSEMQKENLEFYINTMVATWVQRHKKNESSEINIKETTPTPDI